LKNNGGELSWFETKKLLSPVLVSLDILNKRNIIHRGISPESLFVDDRGVVKIGGFSICSARALYTEIEPELFTGYSAPEQYSRNENHGNWTDVYSVGALLYKTLTGVVPPDATIRVAHDTLTPPCEINTNISLVVSNAIVKALSYNPRKRQASIGEFALELFDEKAAISMEKIIKEKKKKPTLLISMGITAGVLIIGAVILLSAISAQRNKASTDNINTSSVSIPSSSKVSTSQSELNPDEAIMPNLLGRVYEDANADEEIQKLVKFVKTTEVYDQKYSKGSISKQSIKAGTTIKKGEEVTIEVSKGTNFPKVPPYQGVKFEVYKSKLDDLGIRYVATAISNPGYASGYVVSVDREEGDTIQIDGDAFLTIEYAQ
jgi:serine/threonine protein kinase